MEVMNSNSHVCLHAARRCLAIVTLLTGLLVALLGILAPTASASTLPHAETPVAAIERPADQFVGLHSSVLAVQCRERAPNYDQDATGSSVGEEWVGENARLSSNGKALISDDGLRQYRFPSYKPGWSTYQANFESRLTPSGPWTSNGHLTITFGPPAR